MIVSQHTHLDPDELQQYLRTLQQRYRRPARRPPETAMHVAHSFGPAPVIKNWRQRVRALPVIGEVIFHIYRRGFFQLDEPFRQTIRALPVLGKLATGIYAILKLPALRRAHAADQQRINALERHARMLTDEIEAVKKAQQAEDLYNLSGEGFDAGRFYSEFSAHFRGSEDDVKKSQMPYVAIVQECLASRESPVVVDIGCGNGIWMRLLAESGIASIGFDLNAIAIQNARAEGLDARFADGIEWLETQATETVDVITAFQVIEHLPPSRLLAFFTLAYRALKPGGQLICETPNPENLLVGACSFHMDFTHRQPIPHVLAKFIAKYTGFSDVRIQGMNAFPEAARLPDNQPLSDRFNQFFYGAQDYALIARK
jgi:O-antigen chain-terminating methyltransferase